jgi:hypothetical protein
MDSYSQDETWKFHDGTAPMFQREFEHMELENAAHVSSGRARSTALRTAAEQQS